MDCTSENIDTVNGSPGKKFASNEISADLTNSLQPTATSKIEQMSTNLSAGAAILELLKDVKGKFEMSDVTKSTLNKYLKLLTREELVDILIQVLGLEDEEKTQLDGECIVSSNEDSKVVLLTTKVMKAERSSGKRKNKSGRTRELKVAFSKTEYEQSAKPLKKRSRLRTRQQENAVSSLEVRKKINDIPVVEKKRKNETDKQVLKLKSRTFVCRTCHETFTSRSVYHKHLQTHSPSVKCDICDKVFKSKDSMYHHQRGLHGKEKPYHCNVCDSYFSFHHSYKLHIQRHKGERPFSCKLCPKTYLTSSHLKEHIRAVHLDSSIICHVCGKKFSYNSALKLHLQSHLDDKTYTCPTCSKEFNSKRALKRHAVHHEENKHVKCKVCGKFFKSDNYLSVHSKLHNNNYDKQFSCDVCGKSFFYKCILDSHLQTHNKLRSFSCTICNKTFKSKASLYSHKYVHTEGLAYSCTICSKSFKTKSCLTAHVKRHQNTNFFVCSICGKTFPEKGGLSKHTKTVHLPHKYYSCKICERTGTRADNMRTHVKSHRNQIGPYDDPMNYIVCIEEPNPRIHPLDEDEGKLIKGSKSFSSELLDGDKVVVPTEPSNASKDPSFEDSPSLLHSQSDHLSSVHHHTASSEFASEKETNFTAAKTTEVLGNDTSEVSVTSNSYHYHHPHYPFPNSMDGNLYNNTNSSTSFYPPSIAKSNPSSSSSTSSITVSGTPIPSPALQMHNSSASSSSFNHFLPNYYAGYIPVETVNFPSTAEAELKNIDNAGSMEFLTTAPTSLSQPSTSGCATSE